MGIGPPPQARPIPILAAPWRVAHFFALAIRMTLNE